jgi:hypothetical protein
MMTKKMTKSTNDKMITSTMCVGTEKPSILNSEFLKHIGYFYHRERERERKRDGDHDQDVKRGYIQGCM